MIKTGHPRFVTGTHKVSNHWYGRAATISEVDGRAVAPRLGGRRGALGSAADGAQGVPARRDRRALGGARPIRAGSAGPDEQAEIHVGFDAVGAEALTRAARLT